MSSAKEIMAQAAAKIETMGAEAAAIDAIYRFTLEGPGGGDYLVTLKQSPKIEATDAGAAECTIKMSASDFVDMMSGKAAGQDLFFAGKMQIDGDMGLAMKLEALTNILK